MKSGGAGEAKQEIFFLKIRLQTGGKIQLNLVESKHISTLGPDIV